MKVSVTLRFYTLGWKENNLTKSKGLFSVLYYLTWVFKAMHPINYSKTLEVFTDHIDFKSTPPFLVIF